MAREYDAQVIEGLFYSNDHDYVKVDGEFAYIGLSDHAQFELGEIVYVELPSVGDSFSAGDVLYVIESVKAAADVAAVVGGEVVEVNEELEGQPDLLNSAPYDNWIVKLKMEDPSQVDSLLNAKDYQELLSK